MKIIELAQLAPELASSVQSSSEEDFVVIINCKPGIQAETALLLGQGV